MFFSRIEYEGAVEWGVVEGKYIRLIDGAPFEDWNYYGSEVRLAHAKYFPPVLGTLFSLREDGSVKRKSAANVSKPGAGLRCASEGMECLCGLAALIGEDGAPCGFLPYGSGALGTQLTETMQTSATVVVRVNGESRAEWNAAELKTALENRLPSVTVVPGDVVAWLLPAGMLQPKDHLEVLLMDTVPLCVSVVCKG